MDQAAHIGFLVAGNSQQGLGHIYRSLAIAKQLSEQTNSTVKFSANPDDNVLNLISNSPFPYDQRLLEDIARIEFPQADLWMVDVPEFGAEYIKKLKNTWPQSKVIAMEYQDYEIAHPDVIINLFDQNPNGNRPPGWVKYHEGIKYGIIREEFVPYQHKPYSPSPTPNVLVIFGSSDVRNYTANVIEASRWVEGPKPTYEVVLGPNVQDRTAVIDQMNDSESQIRVHSTPSNLAEIMAGCSLAVCGGGTTMMELAFLGIPFIAIPQTDVEDKLANLLADEGSAQVLNIAQGNDPRMIATALESLLSDPGRLKSMRKNGQRAIDGLGISRILGIIDQTLAKAA